MNGRNSPIVSRSQECARVLWIAR